MRTNLIAFALSGIAILNGSGTPVCVAQDPATSAVARAESLERFKNLKAFYTAYWAHHEANWQKPGREAARSWDDLAAAGLSPDVRKFLEANGFTVVLGIKYHELKNGTSDVMLAYSTKTFQYGEQQFGHIAVFMDGHHAGMTEGEFKESQKILEPYLKKAVLLPAPKEAR